MTAAGALPGTVAETAALLDRGGYVADRELATTVHLSLVMGRPLFLEGEPGTGKTEIAKVLASGAKRIGATPPMFDTLSDKFNGIFEGLRRRGALSEADVNEALREVRLAMLDADVALPVVKDFIAKVRARAIGAEVLDSVSPGQTVAKIVNDALVEALGGAGAVPLNLAAPAPIPFLMVGLQGSGKTTSSGKLALRLRTREKKRVLLASLDTQRPAAQLQLAQLAERAGVPSLPIVAGETPVQIARRAMDAGRREGFDIVILDTAGRLSIDQALMDEVRAIREATNPVETLLVVDAMTGQDAVNTAQAFNDSLGVTGVILTRMDGDARGGAALSMRHVTGAPIKFSGSGEKIDALEEFHPERVAGRILGTWRYCWPGRTRGRDDRPGRGGEACPQDDGRAVHARRLFSPAQADQQDGLDFLDRGNAAWHGPDEAADRGRQYRSDDLQAPPGDDFQHDDQGAPGARDHQGEPQEAHCGGLGRGGVGGQQIAQAIR